MAQFPAFVAPLCERFAALAGWGWFLAFGLTVLVGCKFLMLGLAGGFPAAGARAWAWFAWPGMNAAAFLDRSRHPARPAAGEWAFALAKIAFGAALVAWPAPGPLVLRGWILLVGHGFVWFFGVFHLLTLVWRAAGIGAPRIFDWPVRARSVGEFWGARWNLAFHDLARRLVFRPLRRRIGARAAVGAVFLASGLIHDLLISHAARAGYGLCTLYFLIQGAAVLLRVRGRPATVAVTALPAGLLFHPAFLARIVG